jgi:hypothetical protein
MEDASSLRDEAPMLSQSAGQGNHMPWIEPQPQAV